MEATLERTDWGSALIRSGTLFAIGMFSILLIGLSFQPLLGIGIGAVLIAAGLYPLISFTRNRKVNVLIGTGTDTYLNSKWLSAAFLSASRERDGFDFDPRSIDPSSVVFGPQRTRPIENVSDPSVYRRSLVDVNKDGVPDLVLYFSGDEAGIGVDGADACLWAKTRTGEKVFGCGKVEYGYETGLNGALEYR